MPDIREVLKALDENDRLFYQQIRTDMRRSYMAAFGSLIHMNEWSEADDSFIDLIDIKVAQLFERAGRYNAHNDGALEPDGELAAEIENGIQSAVVELYKPKPTLAQKALDQTMQNNETRMPDNGLAQWPTQGTQQ